MLKKMKNKPLLNILLWLLLLAELVLIFYVNITKSAVNIDSDSAKLFVHAIEMSKNGTFFVPGWKYITTMELDCSLLLAVPLYNITKNIYLSFSIANMVFLFVLLWSVYRISACWDNEIYFLIAALLICIPYEIDSLGYLNMMFFNGSQYIVKVTLPIMLVSLLFGKHTFKEKSRLCIAEDILFAAVYFVMLFVSSLSSGVYVLACGIVPVIAGCFVWRIYDKQKQRIDFFVISALSAVAAVMGFVLNVILEIDAKGNSMILCKMEDLLTNTTMTITAFFQVFKAMAHENVPVMSYAGINILCRLIFALGLLICGFVAFRMAVKRKLDEVSVMLLSVFAWNFFVLCVCDTRYSPTAYAYRYHLIGIIPLMCIAAKMVFDYIRNHEKYVYIIGFAVIFAAVAVLNITSYKEVFDSVMDERYSQFCTFAQANPQKRIYILNDNKSVEICRLMDRNNEYFEVDDDGNIRVDDYYAVYDGVAADFTDSYLLYRKDLGEETELCGHTFVMCGKTGDKYIYKLK